MPDLLSLGPGAALAVFAASALAVGIAGVFMAEVVDRLADRTGLGEAIAGGLLLGASTSLSGFVTSVSTAAQGYPDLAFSNAVGGIAVQTFFLALADIFYRRANLEHAAASLTNLSQSALLIALLSLPLIAASLPPWSVLGVHPVTPLILLAYIAGLRLANATRMEPLWGPTETSETRRDVPDEPAGGGLATGRLFLRFLLLAVVVGCAGYAIGQSGLVISEAAGLSQTLVGALLTAVATSLPELVTSIAAVRRGALTLAVGGIIGGNTFDVLLVAASDVAYQDGSLYHAFTEASRFIVMLTILMTGILLLGLLRREKHGFANIGFESLLLILVYLGGVVLLVAGG